jgi:uncharacterized protein YkwD
VRLRAATAAALAALAAAAAGAERGAPLAAYGPEPRFAPSALERDASARVLPRLARAGAHPRPSAALARAARELAALAAGGAPDPIARGRLRGALARALSHDVDVAAILAVDAPENVADAVARSLPRRAATHVGAGAVERDGRAWLVLLLADRKLRLDPFPREVASGARAVLSGSLLPPLARPRVFVARPSGRVVEAGGAAGPHLRVELEFPGAGRHVVQVVAEGEAGPEVAALITVSAGGAPLDGPPASPPRDPPDPAAADAAVLDALNATRRRHGLAPLRADPRLADVARRHSEAMAVAGRVAHLVPGSPAVADRLGRAGVPYRIALENVARAAGALAAHAEAEESPAHLANVLQPEPTLVGIGVARGRLPSGDPTVYLTEILVEPPDDHRESPLALDARVREALWGERARRALPPLTSDPALDALAREAAARMLARDETDPDGLGERALELRRKVAAVDVFVATDPAEAVRSTNLRDRRFGRVGVGVASGGSRRFGEGRLWIAVVYTD